MRSKGAYGGRVRSRENQGAIRPAEKRSGQYGTGGDVRFGDVQRDAVCSCGVRG